MNRIELIDQGVIEYGEAWDLQKQIFEQLRQDSSRDGYLLYCEHPHVYTLGKSGSQENILVSEEFLNKINASFFRIDRGGDITYHGYGQLVGYPILNLEHLGIGVREYVFGIEESIINTISHWGIEGIRVDGATGVWVKHPSGANKKICAIGIKASRYITMHGFALNVNTDLAYFNHINPCGFTPGGVTSISDLRKEPIDFEEVKRVYAEQFARQFHCEIEKKYTHVSRKKMDSHSRRE